MRANFDFACIPTSRDRKQQWPVFMHQFPFALWQHSLDGGDSARFCVGAPLMGDEIFRKTEAESTEADSLESLRCDVIILLSNRLTKASIERPHWAPFLMDALDNAIESLLGFEQESEILAVQGWLCGERGDY